VAAEVAAQLHLLLQMAAEVAAPEGIDYLLIVHLTMNPQYQKY
jgi:hypothetical protein